MGFKRYRGPVDTVEQAMAADMTVTIRCLMCNHEKHIHAYRLVKQRRATATLKLREPVRGFRCTICRSDEVTISTAVHWA
jgi:transcription elongation factor Elf1